jgi:hypothetical protein
MRSCARLLVLPLLAASVAAQAQELQDLGPGAEPGSHLFLEMADLQIAGDLRIVAIRTVPDPNSPRKSPKGEGETIDYLSERHTFNCAQNRYHIDNLMYYYIDGDFDTENYDPDQGWEMIAAGSLRAAVFKIVCAITPTAR